MTTKSKFKSDAFAAIHASATALQKIGAIDITTMRQFDASCLATPVPLEPMQIKKIRECARVSQPIFARSDNLISTHTEHLLSANNPHTNQHLLERWSMVCSDQAVSRSDFAKRPIRNLVASGAALTSGHCEPQEQRSCPNFACHSFQLVPQKSHKA